MSNHYQVELEQQPIELYKLLKIANLVSGGGEAKVVISEGYVFLNGDVEFQKRKKIYHSDIIEFNGDIIELICHNDIVQPADTQAEIITSTVSNDVTTSEAIANKNRTADITENEHTNSPKPRVATNLHKPSQKNQASKKEKVAEQKSKKTKNNRPPSDSTNSQQPNAPKPGQRRAIKF